ncbi:ABC transporter permease [Raoultibacter phocaeensis]|uniref:ABC transporter permease n=1 Tax=Raoultibacter phocaeensis TaxID=2479841 RepID=UPI001118CFFE|nr:ABC transporter permease [Raoultibacter phocaeensis]
MRAKLAVRNIKRSFKDYAIYFITLVFGVAVFYAFNSIQNQAVLFDLADLASTNVFELTGQILSLFSLFIACVLGFLIVYANRFLIRRRKHEFGIYLTLGMRPSMVTQIVLIETILVGLVSLAVGLALGIALSQGLSFVTAGLFDIPMGQYRFVFSANACMLTLICFAVIFLIVALFNTFTVNRYKLIDLLSARSKNEKLKTRRPAVSFALFVVSIAVLATAYTLLVQNGLVLLDDPKFFWATVLMVAGTALFFYSLSGFAIAMLQRSKRFYLKGLNTFTVRQIASKVNTAFASLSVVCVMLFFSITVFSCGMGMVEAFTSGVEQGTRYDASLTSNLWWDAQNIEDMDPEYQEDARRTVALAREYDFDIEAYLASLGVDWDAFADRVMPLDLYQVPDLTYGQLVDVSTLGLAEDRAAMMRDTPVQIMGESQFNALRDATGENPIDLGGAGYAVNNLNESGKALSEKLATLDTPIAVGGIELASSSETVYSQPTDVHAFSGDAAQLVVPDRVVEALEDQIPYISVLNVDYAMDRAAGDAALTDALGQALPPSEQNARNGFDYQPDSWPVSSMFTANEVITQAGGMRMLITYLALYIGFVFLITTAAVLAIQQLSETSDSLDRYRLLSKLGCDRPMIGRSLLAQVLVYFLAPLGLAVCHAACAIAVTSSSLFSALNVSIAGATVMTVVLVVVVYGSYLLVTYAASRSIVGQALRLRG